MRTPKQIDSGTRHCWKASGKPNRNRTNGRKDHHAALRNAATSAIPM